MKHHRIYQALKRLGFSPSKALEILIDARRRDPIAYAWIKVARRHKC